MNKLRLFALTAGMLFISLIAFSQQLATINGVIKTSDGKPAAYVNVGLKNTKYTTSTNEKGFYSITKIKPGLYTVISSFVGLKNQEKQLQLTANETAVVDLVITESSAHLQEVIVSARNVNKINTVVAKMPLKNLENPQVYTSVTSETMKQQVISNYDDALQNVPGITRTWGSTGRGGDGGSYFALRGFEAQPALVNGLPGLVSGNLDPANVERIEVMKGPSGTLFGASFYGYGGIINTITKKPYHKLGGEFSYNIGSFGLHRLTADINTPLSKTKKIAFRLNTALQTENTFQDAGFKKSFFIAPSFVYEVNDKLSFNLLAEILEEKRAVAPIFFNSDRANPLDLKNIEEFNLNNKLSFTNNDLTIRNPRKNLQAQALYKFDDQWNSQTVFSAGNIKSKGIYTYIYDVNPDQRNYFGQSFSNQDFNTTTIDVQQNFNGDFKIGNLRNRLLIGLDYYTRTVRNKSSNSITTRSVNPQGDVILKDPSYGDGLNKSTILDSLAATVHSDSKITTSTYSAYASNVLNITPALTAMVSLRLDYFTNKANVQTDNYNQLTFSPKFGLVYQPIIDKLSIFANYMNAFYNIPSYEIFDANNVSLGIKAFKPERANQTEFGVKANLFSDKLFATISIYDIKVANRVYFSPTSAMQGGKTQSRGIELELNGNPIPELNLIAGFSHGKIKVIEGNEATPTDFYNEVGRSPGGQGPQTLANFWATYKCSSGALKDFGIGFGGNYAGIYKVIDNSVTGVFNLPSYTLLNASIFYNSSKVRVTGKLNNLTNETYYTGYWSVNPQMPRNFAASVAYKF